MPNTKKNAFNYTKVKEVPRPSRPRIYTETLKSWRRKDTIVIASIRVLVMMVLNPVK